MRYRLVTVISTLAHLAPRRPARTDRRAELTNTKHTPEKAFLGARSEI